MIDGVAYQVGTAEGGGIALVSTGEGAEAAEREAAEEDGAASDDRTRPAPSADHRCDLNA